MDRLSPGDIVLASNQVRFQGLEKILSLIGLVPTVFLPLPFELQAQSVVNRGLECERALASIGTPEQELYRHPGPILIFRGELGPAGGDDQTLGLKDPKWNVGF
jgi:hypothetical protein